MSYEQFSKEPLTGRSRFDPLPVTPEQRFDVIAVQHDAKPLRVAQILLKSIRQKRAENSVDLFVGQFNIDKVFITTCPTGKFRPGDLYSD